MTEDYKPIDTVCAGSPRSSQVKDSSQPKVKKSLMRESPLSLASPFSRQLTDKSPVPIDSDTENEVIK